MTISAIRQATVALNAPRPLAERLTAAYLGLDLAEHALRDLAHLNRAAAPVEAGGHGDVRRRGEVRERGDPHQHAVQAKAAVARAPSLPGIFPAPLPRLSLAEADEDAVIEALAGLADALVLALIETAHQAALDGGDRAACLRAAPHCCHLHHSLTC